MKKAGILAMAVILAFAAQSALAGNKQLRAKKWPSRT